MKRIITPAVICLLAAVMLVGANRHARPVAAAEGFDVCIEDDDTKGTSLKINSTTGDYVFCVGGKSFTGKGTVVKAGGNLVILEHLAGDRKLTARIDNGAKNGIASYQSPAGKTLGTIKDANTADSKCECR